MGATPVTLDMSTARPINPDGGGSVSLDMRTARPLDGSAPSTPSGTQTQTPSIVDNLEQGATAGAMETTAGLSRIGLKIPGVKYVSQKVGDALGLPGDVDAGQMHAEMIANDEKQKAMQSTSGIIGYGGESLAEFLSGDEIFKGLTWGAKLTALGKIGMTLEQYPLLIKTLKVGADITKLLSDGTPEVRELIKAHPILGRMAAGIPSALRGGVTQATQTQVRTGNTGQAAIEGGEMAGFGAATHAALAPVAAGLAKAKGAATTVADMAKAGDNAIPEQTLFQNVGDELTNKRQQIDQTFDSATKTADQTLDTTTQGAKDAREAAVDTASQGRQSAEDEAQAQLEQHRATADAGQRQLDIQAQQEYEKLKGLSSDKLQQVRQTVADRLVTGLESVAKGAQDPGDMAELMNKGINRAENQAHDVFEQGISGEDGIETRLEGETANIADSSLSKMAGDILNEPVPEDKATVRLAKSISGDKLDAKTKSLLETLRDGAETTQNEQGESVQVPLEDHNIHDLVQLRQSIRKAADEYVRGDINARALRRLLPAIDDTIEKMADNVEDSDAAEDYRSLRENYRKARTLLDSTTAEKLNLKGEPDKALDDVSKYLLGGGNPTAKIATMRNILGYEPMQQLALSKVKQWSTLAADKPEQFVKQWSKIGDDVKQAFFGSDLIAKLDDEAAKFTAGSQAVDAAEDTASTAIKQRFAGAKETASNVTDAYKDAARKAAQQTRRAAGDKYDEAVKAARDAYDGAVSNAKELHGTTLDSARAARDTASEPFKGSFMNSLADGRINDALKSGQVDVQDVRNLKSAIGNDKFQDIADGIFQRAIADSTTGKNFNPSKMMDWWNKISPDVRREMFNLDDPALRARYSQTINQIKGAARVQNVLRAGVIPAVVPIGTKIATVFPHGLDILAGIAGGATVAGNRGVRNALLELVDYVANHKAMWKTVSAVGKAAPKLGTLPAKVIGKEATDAVNKDQLRNALSSVRLH